MTQHTTQPRCECGGAFCGEGATMIEDIVGCLIAVAFGIVVSMQFGGEA